MMIPLVFASTNKNKISEIAAILPSGYKLLSLDDIMLKGEIEETGKTISENSLIKARSVADYLRAKNIDYPVFADDSGLEVDALDGAPGVHSARYAGEHRSVPDNNKKLLEELKHVTKRQARFVTVISFIKGEEVKTFEGEIKGTIAHEPRGSNGFGYDPLFIPRGYRSTFAELSPAEKNSISHRAQAVIKLVAYLKNS
jgi:XTP/dITP diphosphohydrolase